MWVPYLAVFLAFCATDVIVTAVTLPIRVSLQTCSLTDSGSISTAFAVSWTFPTSSAILSKPPTVNFQQAPGSKSNWYTILDTSMSVDTTFFTTAITGQITITANTWEGVCINKLTVNGIYVTGSLPTFVDSPCNPDHVGYACSGAFVGSFQLYPPLNPVSIRFTTCDEFLAGSPNDFLLEFPTQSMATTISNVGDRALSKTQTVYLKSYIQSQTMKISTFQNEGWCLNSVTVEGRGTTFASTWLDNPCGGSLAYAGTLGCVTSTSFTFTLGSPTVRPTFKPSTRPSFAPTSYGPTTKPTFVPTAPTAKPTSAMPTYTVTQNPTAKPTTAMPTYTVTQNPTAVPTSARPTARPTAAPSQLPAAQIASIVSSPTYEAKCGTGFAAIDPTTGMVATWGTLVRSDAQLPQDGVTHAVTMAADSGQAVVAGRAAFAAVLAGGTVTAWGATSVLVGSAFIAGAALSTLVANDNAFAGVTTDGAVFAFGADFAGGNVLDDTKCNGYSVQLSTNVVGVAASSAAFAAITATGDVYAWGSKYAGGGVSTFTNPELSNVVELIATRTAFAAITSARAVVTWGDKLGGGDSSAVASLLTSDVMHVVGSQSVFVAFKYDGSLVVWGNSLHGGDVTAVAPLLAGGVMFVTFNAEAAAALKTDGTVVTWGVAGSGGNSAAVSNNQNLVQLYHTKYAFAALTSAGGVVAWGEASEGGLIPSTLLSALSSGVQTVHATTRAFAALKSSGEVIVWGNAYFGGDAGAAAPHLASGVVAMCANDVAFTAMKVNGTAVVWGHPSSIPYPGVLDSELNFQNIIQCA